MLDRVLHGVEGVGAHRLAGGVDVCPVELGQGRGEVADDFRLRDALGARADDRVAVRVPGGTLLQPGDQVRRGNRLGGDDERVVFLPADRVVLDAHRDVRHRHLGLEAVRRPLDEVLAGDAEARPGAAGEKELAGFVGAHRVVHGERRIAVHHLADRLDPVLGEDRHRHLDPGARRLAQLAGVDQLPDGGLVLRRGDGDERHLLGALADGLQQLATAGDLVEEDQQRLCLGGIAAHV